MNQISRATFEELGNRFVNLNQINQGAYGQIVLGQCNRTGQRVAIKRLPKGQNEMRVKNEIMAGNLLRGIQGIPHFYESFETSSSTWLVFEYIEGKDLLTHLESHNYIGTKEKNCKQILKELINIIEAVHNRGFAHKDIKLENVMWNEETGRVHLVDFGLCYYFSKSDATRERFCQDFAGSREYASPELTMSRQPFSACSADVWSLGVTLFALYFGVFPFAFDENEVSLMRMTRRHPSPNFPTDRSISPVLKDLIVRMLAAKSSERIKLEEIKSHPFLSKKRASSFIENSE